jgi:hypothetical protein
MYDRTYCKSVPVALLDGLELYATRGVPTGDFLRAVLSNDLRMAVGRADDRSLAALREIVMFTYNEMPPLCQGSPERVASWIKAFREDER